MGKILGKPKSKLKDFFDTSKKMIQPPKELPEITSQKKPEALELPTPPQKQQAREALQKELRLQPEAPKRDFKLPTIAVSTGSTLRGSLQQTQPSRNIRAHEDDMKKFEEAISNINIDMIHSEIPSGGGYRTDEEYYKPSQMGEGYFSEIEHYIKNKDVNEIIDDVLKKDFLTSMKDYHDTKAQGKAFYFNKEDLKNKLKIKMEQLRRLEEEWHSIKLSIEEEEKKKRELEQVIERQSQELKNIFRQIKINQWFEQEAMPEHYFRLRNGQELKSLNDLRKALTYMSDEDFTHHVTPERNDFATWIREALQNPELYEKIRNIKTKEELEGILQNPF